MLTMAEKSFPIRIEQPHKVKQRSRRLSSISVDDIDKHVTTLQSVAEEQNSSPSVNPQQQLTQVNHMLQLLNLGDGQKKVLNRIKDHLSQLGPHRCRDPLPPKPLNLLVTGMPGMFFMLFRPHNSFTNLLFVTSQEWANPLSFLKLFAWLKCFSLVTFVPWPTQA